MRPVCFLILRGKCKRCNWWKKAGGDWRNLRYLLIELEGKRFRVLARNGRASYCAKSSYRGAALREASRPGGRYRSPQIRGRPD